LITQRLLMVGLNHATAPLEVRERLAFTAEQRASALAALRQQFDGCEAVLINTCNRVELYAARSVHARPREEDMSEFLAAQRNVPADQLRPHLYHKAERDAVEHLFSVVSSIDSMVIGETQILGQVRDAYDAARAAGAAAAAMNPLFQRALAVGKQVMHDTAIGEGRVSVGSVAVDCAGHIFERYEDKTVLCIGAGKMATLVLQSFSALKPRRMLICNRNNAKAQALAERFNGVAAPFEKLDEHLVAADVVVTSASATEPIITRARFEPLLRARRYRPVFVIDIALPRNVEPAVSKLENVYLYNIDDLQKVVAATRTRRSEAIEHARTIIRAHVDDYLSWNRQRALGPMIDRLYTRHHELAREEVERAIHKMPNVSEADRAALEDLARRIVNKMLHDPISRLKDAEAEHGTAGPYLHALEKLFRLEEPQPPGEMEPRPDEPRSED
jgi:glutamyl-tRNA reductase